MPGYDGSYDAVRRYSPSWSTATREASASAYVPLSFDPVEAYQFDWSHEIVVLDGVTTTVKVARVRFCHSPMPFVRAYPARPKRWYSMRTTMRSPSSAAPVPRDRAYNRRVQQMCGHYLVDPVACTPASGWEKGQVENQVGVLRRRFFVPRPKLGSDAELNAWLEDRCIAHARANRHPDIPDKTIWEVFEAERSSLVPYVGPIDGFHVVPASVSKTCLVRFDKNRYSVDARAVGRPVEIRAYADRLECWQDGQVVGRHDRAFGRAKTIYDPLHYIPVLARKPGALRNGAPFKDWHLSPARRRVQRKLERQPGVDRQVVEILGAVLTDGLDAVEAACAEALAHNVHSAGVVLTEHPGASPRAASTPDHCNADALKLGREPAASCDRYDSLRGTTNGKIAGAGPHGPSRPEVSVLVKMGGVSKPCWRMDLMRAAV